MPKIVLIGGNAHLIASLEGVLDNLDHGFFTHSSASGVDNGLSKVTDDTQVIICDNDTPRGAAVQMAQYLDGLGKEYPKLIVVSGRPGMVNFFDEACSDQPYYAGTLSTPVTKGDFISSVGYALVKPEPVEAPEPVTEPTATPGPV